MKVTHVLIALVVTLTALAACTGSEYQTPAPDPALVQRIDLGQALGQKVRATGVAVEASTGRRLVLDASRGIFELSPEGGASLIWDIAKLPQYEVEVLSDFTDIESIDDGLVTLTALNNGFLLDLDADTLIQHYCYVPGDFDPEPEPEDPEQPAQPSGPPGQLARAVTYDAEARLIIAQPQTIFGDAFDRPTESLVSTYDLESGVDLQWFNVPDMQYAGGMALEDSDTLLMGFATTLERYTMSAQTLERSADLRRFGVTRVEGLAFDRRAGTLLIVDGPSGALIELSLEGLF